VLVDNSTGTPLSPRRSSSSPTAAGNSSLNITLSLMQLPGGNTEGPSGSMTTVVALNRLLGAYVNNLQLSARGKMSLPIFE
jgi:hypothetical protein